MAQTGDSHSKVIGYALRIFGVTGSHRFYYGKPVTGTIWFFTRGLLGIVYLLSAGLLGLGYVYDYWTLNDQIADINRRV